MKPLFALPLSLFASACMSYPPPPPITPNAPGDVYRAVGHAPEWTMTIDESLIAFYRPGQPPVTQPTPPVIVGFAGEIYQTPRIGVNLPHVGCTDSVTGQRFRDRAEVTVDGVRYVGCGGEPAGAAGLAGTRWRVVAVNGRPTPPAGEFYLNFEAERFGAKLGCNGLGANYQQDGDTILPGPVIGTKMACPDMSFEMQGGAVLGQRMTISRDGQDSMTLSSSAGTIVLRRSY